MQLHKAISEIRKMYTNDDLLLKLEWTAYVHKIDKSTLKSVSERRRHLLVQSCPALNPVCSQKQEKEITLKYTHLVNMPPAVVWTSVTFC